MNSNRRNARIVERIAAAVVAFAAFAACAVTHAAVADASASPDTGIHFLIERELAGFGGRVEISVGQLDPRIALQPCAKIEPFLPPGARAWGRVNVGMRCREGATWTAYVPVTVKVFGTALAAAKSLVAGTVPGAADVEALETELTREPGTPVVDLKQLEGRVLARSLFPGQVLRIEQFRAAPAIAQGDQVKVVATGPGFTVTTDGEALAQALEGQAVRVKTDAGRIVSGTARSGRIVELRF